MDDVFWLMVVMLAVSIWLFLDTMICLARFAVGESLVRLAGACYFLYVSYLLHGGAS